MFEFYRPFKRPQEQSVPELVSEAKEVEPLQIVEGGFYRNRLGEKIGPMTRNTGTFCKTHPWKNQNKPETYQQTGKYEFDGKGPSDADLIAPWPDQPAQAPAVDIAAHEREELRKANEALLERCNWLERDGHDWENLAKEYRAERETLRERVKEFDEMNNNQAQTIRNLQGERDGLAGKVIELKNEEREMFKAGLEGIKEADKQIASLKDELATAKAELAEYKAETSGIIRERDRLFNQLGNERNIVDRWREATGCSDPTSYKAALKTPASEPEWRELTKNEQYSGPGQVRDNDDQSWEDAHIAIVDSDPDVLYSFVAKAEDCGYAAYKQARVRCEKGGA
jgi:hypothetical protein